jgi:hypothetical protein
MKRKKYEQKSWLNTTREEIEKDHYPIWWEIDEGVITITDKRGRKLSKNHMVYTNELSFIQEEISRMTFQGEILCV